MILCTHMARTDADGERIDVDMLIRFAVVTYTAGSRATWMQPADPAEFEFEVTSIEFDSGRLRLNTPPDDAPWPLTDAEDATLRAWFDANYDQAWQVAVDHHDNGPDPDRAYDERRDREMEQWHGPDDYQEAAQ